MFCASNPSVRFPGCTTGGERGIAIVVVMIVMVIVAGLTTAALFLAIGEERTGRGYIRHQHAFAAAEAGVFYPVTNWNQTVYNAMPVDDSIDFAGRLADGTGSFNGILRRLNRTLYFVTAEGTEAGSRTQHMLGLIVRLHPLPLTPRAALVTRGPLSIGPSSIVDGYDQPPSGWDCQAARPPLSAISTQPSDSTAYGLVCVNPPCIRGDPPILLDSSMTLPDLTMFNGLRFDDLRNLAAVLISRGVIHPGPRVEGETCVTAAADNWGDPYVTEGTCGDYMPLVYSTGDLEVTGGRGQGTLVVDGDLTIGGGFHFAGLVVVRGVFVSRGTGNQLEGAIVVANAGLKRSSFEGATTVRYSSCAVRRARIGAGAPRALRQRSWFQAY